MQFSEEKKLSFFFLGSGPKIGSVGTWETDNQLDVPRYRKKNSDPVFRGNNLRG